MTEPDRQLDAPKASSALGKAFNVFVWVFIIGTALVTVFYVALFIIWGMSV